MRTMKSQTFTTEPMVWSSRNFLRKLFIPLLPFRVLAPSRVVVDGLLGVQYLLIFDEADDDDDDEGAGRC